MFKYRDPIHKQEGQDAAERKQRQFGRRIYLLLLAVVLGFMVLIWRVFVLQIRKYDWYRTRALSNRVRILAVTPVRGTIFDRHGVALTENILRRRVVVYPFQVVDKQKLLSDFAEILPLSAEEISRFEARYRASRRYEAVVLKESIDEQAYYRLSARLFRLPAVVIEPFYERYYPFGSLFSHVLGYINRISGEDLDKLDKDAYQGLSVIGRAGIERQYEARLRGRAGYEQVETDANGNVVRLLQSIPALRGQDIYLTLDAKLQRFIDTAMGELRGSCVAIAPETGEVLAMVSKPSYDANLFVRGISQRHYQRLLSDAHSPLFDRALKGRYAPGSVIKPMMSLAGRYYGVSDGKLSVECRGYYRPPDAQSERRFHCWHRQGHGVLQEKQAIAQSCDVYYYQLGYRLGIDRLQTFASAFGFGAQTGIDLPNEEAGVLPSKTWKMKRFSRPWYIGDTINASIGQGFWATTPLQLACMTAILARDGMPFTPYLLQAVFEPELGKKRAVSPTQPIEKLSIYQQEDWQAIKQAMIEVAHGKKGSAKAAFAGTPYQVAGKSGTVQVVSFQSNQRVKQEELAKELRDNAMFIAFAPADKPKIALAMVLERAGGGSSVAAPIVRQICDYFLRG